MPTREEEYWAGQRKGKGQGLCPRCGKPDIEYGKYIGYWICNKCFHKFPTPSYGGGKSLEEVTGELRGRHLAEQQELKRKEFEKADRKKREESEGETSQSKGNGCLTALSIFILAGVMIGLLGSFLLW